MYESFKYIPVQQLCLTFKRKIASTPQLFCLCVIEQLVSSTAFAKARLGHQRGARHSSLLPLFSGVYTNDPPIVHQLLQGLSRGSCKVSQSVPPMFLLGQVSISDRLSSPRQGRLSLNPHKRRLLSARGLSASCAALQLTFPPNCPTSVQMYSSFFASSEVINLFSPNGHGNLPHNKTLLNN